jgi:hypothetical protein
MRSRECCLLSQIASCELTKWPISALAGHELNVAARNSSMILTRAAVLTDVVALTSSSLSLASIERMARIERKAVEPNITTIAVHLDLALGAVVAAFA